MPNESFFQNLPPLEADLDIIQKLDDQPNTIGGMAAQDLKRQFDLAGNTIKDYLNSVLIQAIKDEGADISGGLAGDVINTIENNYPRILYAASGDSAHLVVDSLSTSRRIKKYLISDTSYDQYIFIHEQKIQYVQAQYNGGTAQAADPDGLALYWSQDISGAYLGPDGLPYIDGEKVLMTVSITEYPVYVYTYDVLVKLSIEFDPAGIQEPLITLGAGWGDESDPDKGKAFIRKFNSSVRFWYHAHDDASEDSAIELFNDHVVLTGWMKSSTITIPASGWTDTGQEYIQSLSVDGVMADSRQQMVEAWAAPDSVVITAETLTRCISQGNGSLVFQCETIPTEDIVFHIRLTRLYDGGSMG